MHHTVFGLHQHHVEPESDLVEEIHIAVGDTNVQFDFHIMFRIEGVGPFRFGKLIKGFIPNCLGSKSSNESCDLGFLFVKSEFNLWSKHHGS